VKNWTTFDWMLAALVIVLLLQGSGSMQGCTTSSPPFKTDKLSVLVVEESSQRGQYTSDQLNVMQATDAKAVATTVRAAGGDFQTIDIDTANALANAAPWVKEAMNVKRESHPWIVAATPRSGFSVPLTTEADALTRIGGLK
jgi:hypothetical protein